MTYPTSRPHQNIAQSNSVLSKNDRPAPSKTKSQHIARSEHSSKLGHSIDTQLSVQTTRAEGHGSANPTSGDLRIDMSESIQPAGLPLAARSDLPELLRGGPREYQPHILHKWPTSSRQGVGVAPHHMQIYDAVRCLGVPNYMGARIPIPSGLNVDEWRRQLRGYPDARICDYLIYGWPISYTANTIPHPTWDNHPSARDYPSHVQDFLDKECGHGVMLGPFPSPPFTPWVQVSPLMTRPKKEEGKRRVILDLSFPEGRGVNAGILMNCYEGEQLNYTLPTVLDFTALIAAAGAGAWLWKVDLERAYRQLRIDPLAYPLLGIRHNNMFYIDICPSFGCRVSGACQQRVSEALCHIMHMDSHQVPAYVDDFGGVNATRDRAQNAFDTFNKTCARLGLKVAADKSAGPSQVMEWLGFQIDTTNMTVTIPHKKLNEVLREVKQWGNKEYAGRRELQSLAGKLAHISTCIRHARKFTSRLLNQLRSTPRNHRHRVGAELRKDLAWFQACATKLNSKQIIQMDWPCFEIECDACLSGGGGFSNRQYYSTQFPHEWRERYHISQIEALNTLVAVKTLLPRDLANHIIRIKTDNAASAAVLVSGRSHDPVLAACSRELAMIVVLQQLEIDVVHVPGTRVHSGNTW